MFVSIVLAFGKAVVSGAIVSCEWGLCYVEMKYVPTSHLCYWKRNKSVVFDATRCTRE